MLAMPAPLRAVLGPIDEDMLSYLRSSDSVPYRVRDLSHMMLMSADGWNAPALVKSFKCNEHTVWATIKQWNTSGLYGLWDKEGRGSKAMAALRFNEIFTETLFIYIIHIIFN